MAIGLAMHLWLDLGHKQGRRHHLDLLCDIGEDVRKDILGHLLVGPLVVTQLLPAKAHGRVQGVLVEQRVLVQQLL
jgi:hypothetical protein